MAIQFNPGESASLVERLGGQGERASWVCLREGEHGSRRGGRRLTMSPYINLPELKNPEARSLAARVCQSRGFSPCTGTMETAGGFQSLVAPSPCPRPQASTWDQRCPGEKDHSRGPLYPVIVFRLHPSPGTMPLCDWTFL